MSTDLKVVQNPTNGRVNIGWSSDGDVLWDDTETHGVMASIIYKRAKWWADSTGTTGSNLTEVKTVTASTKSDAEAYVREGLDPLVKAGRIDLRSVVVSIPANGLGRITVTVYWASRGGPPQKTEVFV